MRISNKRLRAIAAEVNRDRGERRDMAREILALRKLEDASIREGLRQAELEAIKDLDALGPIEEG